MGDGAASQLERAADRQHPDVDLGGGASAASANASAGARSGSSFRPSDAVGAPVDRHDHTRAQQRQRLGR